MVEHINMLSEIDHQWDLAGRRENGEFRAVRNAAELLSEEKRLSYLLIRGTRLTMGVSTATQLLS